MAILVGIAALAGTVCVQLTKLIVVDLPTIIANGGTIIVTQMSK